jgi:protein-tyrosine phosphatase
MRQLKFYTILPDVLYQRAHMERFPAEYKFDVLRDFNINLVFGLFKRPDPDLVDWPDGTYVHHHFPDGKTLDRGAYEALADLGVAHVRAGRGAVLTHCHGGRNRSGLLSALIVRQLTGCSGSEAIERVMVGRPRALANPYFCEYLRELP